MFDEWVKSTLRYNASFNSTGKVSQNVIFTTIYLPSSLYIEVIRHDRYVE